jgi:hypothetical protein
MRPDASRRNGIGSPAELVKVSVPDARSAYLPSLMIAISRF